MRWSDILMERQGPAVLYHKTNADEAARIIFTNKLAAFTSHRSDQLGYRDGPEFIYGVSLTRSLQFARSWRDAGVIFVLDERKLRQRFRIRPFDYNKGGFKNSRDEAEEFVMSDKGIFPLDRYLVEITMPRDLYDMCVADNSEYTDPHNVEDTRYAALTDHPLLKVI